MAPAGLLSTTVAALVPRATAQAAMVPPSVSKMNTDFTPGETSKPVAVLLNTMPVGAAGGAPPGGGGMVTCRPSFAPAPLYSVDRPVSALLTQKGPVGERASPQGLTRAGSIVTAGTAPSETRFLISKWVAARAACGASKA